MDRCLLALCVLFVDDRELESVRSAVITQSYQTSVALLPTIEITLCVCTHTQGGGPTLQADMNSV